ncbi:MAG: hypothetical protein ACRDK8_08615, partial [Solirubrobacteraceae bacterium]
VDERDRRSSLIALTPEGRALADEFLVTLEGQLSELLGSWTTQRQKTTARRISEIAQALDRQRPPPDPAREKSAQISATSTQR